MKQIIYAIAPILVIGSVLSGCKMTDLAAMAPAKSSKARSSGPASHPTETTRALSVDHAKQVSKNKATTGSTKSGVASVTKQRPSNIDDRQLVGEVTAKEDMAPLPPVDLSRFYGGPLDKNITHYVRGIMHDLVANLHYVNDKTPIGVTSFIFLDGAYDKSNLLGNQIAESFMHEVHQFGIPVIDYKTTDYIRVTESGDFIFSRDFLDLKESQPIKYVLAGTLVKHRSGLIVNARIIGLLSKAIVASAQGFIPSAIAESLMPSVSKGEVSLVQGE